MVEKELDELPYPNFKWVQGKVVAMDPHRSVLHLASGACLTFDKLCICTGAAPRRLPNSPEALVLRDTDSVAELAARLHTAKRVAVVGNGGIGLELA